jgi:DNA-binding NarL/FixJ family response regulator
MEPTVIIIDPNELFREGIASILCDEGFNAVAYNVRDFYKILRTLSKQYPPTLFILEYDIAEEAGRKLIEDIKQANTEHNVMILSSSEETKHIIGALKAGAGAYLTKEVTLSDLITGIKCIIEKGFHVNEMVSGRLLVALRDDSPNKNTLSDRELEFLQWCATELTYAEIGQKMNVSARTIDNYRSSLFAKFNIASRTGLVVYGLKKNLIKI